MTIDPAFQKIMALDTQGLEKWVENRLMGLPSDPMPQTSKGEDPEDAIIAMYRSSEENEFRARLVEITLKLLRDKASTVTTIWDCALVARLAYVSDALQIKAAASLMTSFLFRKEFGE